MPIYDYKCPECGIKATTVRSIHVEEEAMLCPHDETEMKREWGFGGFKVY